MRLTLVQKLLVIFLGLVLGSLVSVSWVYYNFFTSHVEDLAQKQQETAFELIFDSVGRTIAGTTPAVAGFIRDSIGGDIHLINVAPEQYDFQDLSNARLYREMPAVFSSYRNLVSAVDRFAPAHGINKLVIYDEQGTARVVYLDNGEQEVAGVYLGKGANARFIPYSTQQLTDLGDQLIQFLSPEELWRMVKPSPPEGVRTQYGRDVPQTTVVGMGQFGGLATTRLLLPITQNGIHAGLVEIDIGLRGEDIRRFASYSHTDINIFVGSRLSLGTLKEYDVFDVKGGLTPIRPDFTDFQLPEINFTEISIAGRAYSQGSLAIGDGDETLTFTANYSRDAIAEQRKALLISIGSVVLILGLFGVLVSGIIGARVNRFLQQILGYLERLARGDIPEKMAGAKRGEFGAIKNNFNALISNYGETVLIAEKIANGELDVHLDERSDKDLLSRSLNTMAENLLQARNTLEQRVMERTAQLAKSEERFRGLVDDIPGVIYRCALDKDWTMEYISEEVRTLIGYPASDFVGNRVRSYASVIHAEDVELVEQGVQKAVAAARPYVLEYRVVDLGDNIHWVYEKGQASYDEQDKPQWLDGAIFDITERKQAEQELKAYQENLEELVDKRTRELEKSNARLQQEQAFMAGVLENIEDGIVACDEKGKLSLFNRATREFLGIKEEHLPPEQWEGRYSLYLADGKTPMETEDIPLFRAFSGEVVHRDEMVVIPERGKKRSLLASGRVITGPKGATVGAVVSLHDITSSKEADRERAANELRIQLLYELNRSLPDMDEQTLCERALDIAVRITDSQVGYLHMVNDDQQNLNLAAWNAEARKHCTASYDNHYPIEMAGVWADAVRLKQTVVHNDYPAMNEKRGLPEGHFPVQRHMSTPALDGDYARLIIGVGNKAAPYDPHDVLQLELIAGDVLKLVMRKRAEQALKIAKEAAERANASKSVFLANMSHELRTPLNAILGFSQLMQNNPAIPESELEHVDIISRSGSHLLELINDVLDMSKIEAGRLQLEPEDFDLGKLVRDVTDMMRVRAEEKGLQLILDQGSDFPRFTHGDSARLRQVFINLLGNAIKFTNSGGVTLRLDAEGDGNGGLILRGEVQDTGIGIKPEDIEQIFLPFEQLAESVSQKGTGLGLAITRQFVEMMQGDIGAESTPGKGSRFHFKIPVEKAKGEVAIRAAAEERRVTGLEPGQREYRILVVEDQPESQLLLKQLLEQIGFSVQIAENGKKAIEAFQDWDPHFIWMDRRMPVMDGLTATRAIRELPGGQNVKIVALTASVFKEEKHEVLEAGCDDFVWKPYRSWEIFDCLARHLGVKYIYQEEIKPSPTPQMDTNRLQAAVARLPAELAGKLRQASGELNSAKMVELLTQTTGHDDALARALTSCLDAFDFQTIQEILSRGGGED